MNHFAYLYLDFEQVFTFKAEICNIQSNVTKLPLFNYNFQENKIGNKTINYKRFFKKLKFKMQNQEYNYMAVKQLKLDFRPFISNLLYWQISNIQQNMLTDECRSFREVF